jgi:SAM-dependent methyltransferase
MIFAPHILQAVVNCMHGAVLDIGTGHGYKLRRLISQARSEITRVVALEPSPLFQKAARELEDCFTGAAVHPIPLAEFTPNEAFDVILLFEVLEHVFLERRDELLRKASSLMKPGGVFVLSTPNRWIYRAKCWLSGERPDPTHVREYSYPELRALLARHFGRVELLGTFPYMGVIRRFPALSWLGPRCPVDLSHCFYAIARAPKGSGAA